VKNSVFRNAVSVTDREKQALFVVQVAGAEGFFGDFSTISGRRSLNFPAIGKASGKEAIPLSASLGKGIGAQLWRR
jgi:hypothetical protein